jgi:uncharacterized protein (TIGR00369 family)
MDAIAAWIEASPYARMLGVTVGEITPERARLVLPFAEGNTNPGQVLHGGVAASLVALAAQPVARALAAAARPSTARRSRWPT